MLQPAGAVQPAVRSRSASEREYKDSTLVQREFVERCSPETCADGPRGDLASHLARYSRQWFAGVGFHQRLSVRLFFSRISQKPMQPGSPKLTWKRFTMSPEKPFISGSKGQRSRSKKVPAWFFALL